MELLIVTGASGSGKSRAVDALEDLGFYCVDNMPPNLLPTFAQLILQSQGKLSRVALVIDVRSSRWFDSLTDSLEQFEAQGLTYKILYLECDDRVLALRFKETRRQHPLAGAGDTPLDQALAAERQLLRPLRSRADYLIDTSQLSPAQLRERVVALFGESEHSGLVVHCSSFGFKYGLPSEADLVFDVRCLPNPFYVDALRHKTGLDADVRAYVLESDRSQGFLQRLYALLDYMLPLYQQEGKSQLVIAVGCTGGKHRSVTMAEMVSRHLSSAGYRVTVNHRDIVKP